MDAWVPNLSCEIAIFDCVIEPELFGRGVRGDDEALMPRSSVMESEKGAT
jgi:hypothetical protein